ncbi:hypothetical protein AgCh_025550 [Apium graveolens]
MSKPVVNMGKEPGTKAYRLYDPNSNKVFVSQDVIFEENKSWPWETNDVSEAAMFIIEAIKKEMQSIEENQNWKLSKLRHGKKVIGVEWIFKLKTDAEGRIVKHKARLIPKGYVQERVVDFDEVFAPMTRPEMVHFLLALASKNKLEVHHLDVPKTKSETFVMDINKAKQGGSIGLSYPILAKNNYTTWALKMKVYTSDVKAPVEEKIDKVTLAMLYQGRPDNMLPQLRKKEPHKRPKRP